MPETGDPGQISLELVIESKVEAQLEARKSRLSAAASKLGDEMGKSLSEAFNAHEIKMPEIKFPDTTAPTIPEPDTSAITNAVDSLNAKIEQIFERLGNFRLPEDQFSAFISGLDAVNLKLDLLQKKWQEAATIPKPEIPDVKVPTTKAELPFDESELERLNAIIDTIREKLNSLTEPLKLVGQKAAELGGKLSAPFVAIGQKAKNVFDGLTGRIEGFGAKAKYVFDGLHGEKITPEVDDSKTTGVFDRIKEKISGISSSLRDKLGKAASAAGSTIKTTLGSAFSAVRSASAKALSSIKSGFNKLTAPVNKFGANLKRAFKSVFLMAGVYAAFRAVKDGLLQAAKADEAFSKSLNEVKANLAIAFTPILQAMMPALNTLMSGLAAATKAVAGFIAGLFGTTYKKAAEATKKLKSTSDAAKKAQLSMAGIDEMNVLSDSDSGSSGSGADYSNIDMTEPELPDWAERLKDSIRSGDWAGVGKILAERVNSALGAINWDTVSAKLNSGVKKLTDGINGFVDALDWGTVGDTIAGGLNTVVGAIYTFFDGINWGNIGKGIASSLNRAVEKTDWKLLGKTIGKRIQSAIDLAHGFVKNFKWAAFGRSIGDSVNSLFESIDFAKLADTLSTAVKGVLDTLINFVQTVNWQQIGSKIAEFVANIDYGGIASRIFELLGSAIAAAVSLIWGAVKNAVAAVGEFFSSEIEQCGGNVVLGLLKGIGDAIAGIAKWINDHIFKPFVDGFKKVFGIHSPSKVMAELGGYIIDGLYNAISDGIKRVKEIFEKVLAAIKAVFVGIAEWFGSVFSEAWDAVTAVFSAVGTWFGDRLTDIKNVFATVGDWFGGIFTGAWDKIKTAFSAVGEFFGGVWESIKSAFSTAVTWFGEKFTAVKDKIVEVFGLIGDAVKTPINGIITVINGLISGIESAVNHIVGALNKLSVDVPDWVPGLGGKHFGFDLPSVDLPEIPKLAQGGLATAPTLAMVGDNRNARSDPEVIAPLSKLEGMIGGNAEILELLHLIVELLRGGINIEIINYMFRNSSEFSREVIKAVLEERARGGAI